MNEPKPDDAAVIKVVRPRSWGEIVAAFSRELKGEKCWFRGHSQADWKLVPTLFREDAPGGGSFRFFIHMNCGFGYSL